MVINEQLSDETLVRRANKGEKEAFSLLVKKHRNLLFSLIMRHRVSYEQGEELLQETFLRAFRKLETFRGEARFSTWLSRIALNLTNSFLVSKRYREDGLVERMEENINYSTDSQEGEARIREKQLERMHELIQALPSHYQETLVLVALERRSYEEAAEILEIPVGTVRSRLSKARELLRKRFFEEDFSE